MILISPSILSADFANLERDIRRVENADMLHVDIMDGHFVPNLSIGIPVVQSVRKATKMFLDVHLMISDPLTYAPRFAEAGADLLCFHYEAVSNPGVVLDEIRKCGVKAGISVKPGTPAEVLEPYIDRLDLVLVMTVEPGFGGQAFQPAMLDKICRVKEMAEGRNPSLMIEVDGGIVPETARRCVDAGANVLVAGSYVFGSSNPAQAVDSLRL